MYLFGFSILNLNFSLGGSLAILVQLCGYEARFFSPDPMHWASIPFAVQSETGVSGVFPQACSIDVDDSAIMYSPFALPSC